MTDEKTRQDLGMRPRPGLTPATDVLPDPDEAALFEAGRRGPRKRDDKRG